MPTTPSPLRYPGGKTKLYSYVRNILEANELLGETYIEPFAGGAGLAFKLLLNGDVKRILINDYDPAIFAFWNCVLNRTDELCELIQSADISIPTWMAQKELYENQENADELSLAFATFFLNRTNVSGVIKGGIIGGLQQNGNYGIAARFNKESLVKKYEKLQKRKARLSLVMMMLLILSKRKISDIIIRFLLTLILHMLKRERNYIKTHLLKMTTAICQI